MVGTDIKRFAKVVVLLTSYGHLRRNAGSIPRFVSHVADFRERRCPLKLLGLLILSTFVGLRYHSAFGVLEYNHPVKKVLWGSSEQFAVLTTAWWVPELFAVAGKLSSDKIWGSHL